MDTDLVYITKEDVLQMRKAMHPAWRKVIFNNLRDMVTNIFTAIGKTEPARCCPPYPDIFSAFNHFAPENTRVVIIGQDPYIKENQAHGYSFSVRNGSMTPSLRNINAALINTCGQQIENGCFGPEWAKQGVLMLNRLLTTEMNMSKAAGHGIWTEFTDAIIAHLVTAAPQTIYILWGREARELYVPLLNAGIDSAKLMTWSHPSPMSDNRIQEETLRFKNCPHFAYVNEIFLENNQTLIKWGSPVETPIAITQNASAPNTYIVFTDGAASKNGRKDCAAGWGYYFSHGPYAGIGSCGPIESADSIAPTNNRGEMMAVILALERIADGLPIDQCETPGEITIIGDSAYVLNVVDKWLDNWIRQGKVESMKNPDYLRRLIPLLARLRGSGFTITCRWMNSHQAKPPAIQEEAFFMWEGNYIADRLACQGAQGTIREYAGGLTHESNELA